MGESLFHVKEFGGSLKRILSLFYFFLKKYPFEKLEINYPPLLNETFHQLYLSSTSYHMKFFGMIKILSLAKNLKGFRSYLRERMQEGEVFEGRLRDERVKILRKEGGLIFSRGVEGLEKKKREWVRIIFGPPPLPSPLHKIFPLPFHWFPLDHA